MNFETQELRELGDVTPYNENFRLGVTFSSLLVGQLWNGWKCTVMTSMQWNCDGVCDINLCVGVDVMEYIVLGPGLLHNTVGSSVGRNQGKNDDFIEIAPLSIFITLSLVL